MMSLKRLKRQVGRPACANDGDRAEGQFSLKPIFPLGSIYYCLKHVPTEQKYWILKRKQKG